MRKTKAAALAALVGICLLTSIGVAGAQAPPSPWTSQDIGAPALAGDAVFASGTFRIDAAGAEIGKGRDEFHFVYQPIEGDVDIRARIDSITPVDKSSQAGVMIRSSLDDDAAHGYAFVSVRDGTAFQRRRAQVGSSTLSVGRGKALKRPRGQGRRPQAAGGREARPQWVRLVRVGTTLTAYKSTDGRSWVLVGSDTVALGRTVYVGLAVTSHAPTRRATAAISNVTLLRSELPMDQRNTDIGRPKVSGGVTYANGAYTIHAGGTDIWDTADQFHFVYQPVTGDVDVIARVRSITEAHRWSKAGVMIRETLDPGSRHAVALTSAAMGHAFHRRTETNRRSSHTSGGYGTAPVWVRLVRTGTLFEAFRSDDGQAWTSMGAEVIPMADKVYVGLAAVSHSPKQASTTVIDGLAITGVREPDDPPANEPPTITVTAPADGTSNVAPATLTVTASAADADGSVRAVEFYANGTLLGRDTSAPYSTTVASVREGTYAVTAVATDDRGASTVSRSISITVSASSAPPPTDPAPGEEPPPSPAPPPPGTAPRGVAFTASDDHETLVTHYVLEIHVEGTKPGSSAPIATSNLGKPDPLSTGDIFVDRSAFFTALAPGNYIASVRAMGTSGSARSESVTFTR